MVDQSLSRWWTIGLVLGDLNQWNIAKENIQPTHLLNYCLLLLPRGYYAVRP